MVFSKAVIPVGSRVAARPAHAALTLGGTLFDGGPPQLVPVANRPLLLHALDAVEAAGVAQVAIVTDEASSAALRALVAEHVDQRALEVEVIDGEGGGAEGKLERLCDFAASEPILLHFADGLLRNGLEPLVDGDGLGAIDARVLMLGADSHAAELTHIEPLLRGPRRAAALKHAGVYALGSRVLELASDRADQGEDPFEPLGLLEAAGSLGGHVETLRIAGSWRIGSRLEGWLDGNRMALDRVQSDAEDAQLYETDVQGRVRIHPSADIRSSVIRGPAVIGPMTRVTDAYVGPYSSIGAGVLIEAAEIENSIVLPGASIRYLGGRLEASIVGARARVFRDFRLPKALRLSVGEGAEVALA